MGRRVRTPPLDIPSRSTEQDALLQGDQRVQQSFEARGQSRPIGAGYYRSDPGDFDRIETLSVDSLSGEADRLVRQESFRPDLSAKYRAESDDDFFVVEPGRNVVGTNKTRPEAKRQSPIYNTVNPVVSSSDAKIEQLGQFMQILVNRVDDLTDVMALATPRLPMSSSVEPKPNVSSPNVEQLGHTLKVLVDRVDSLAGNVASSSQKVPCVTEKPVQPVDKTTQLVSQLQTLIDQAKNTKRKRPFRVMPEPTSASDTETEAVGGRHLMRPMKFDGTSSFETF